MSYVNAAAPDVQRRNLTAGNDLFPPLGNYRFRIRKDVIEKRPLHISSLSRIGQPFREATNRAKKKRRIALRHERKESALPSVAQDRNSQGPCELNRATSIARAWPGSISCRRLFFLGAARMKAGELLAR